MSSDKYLHFENDYVEGAHPKVLQSLIDTNELSLSGYATDEYTKLASDKIKSACNRQNADIWFLVGGTQTNALVIDAMLKPFEGVISADTGHIATHEAGAIEFTGHKVITISGVNGKLIADDVDSYITNFYANPAYEHTVPPGMVYISLSTEYGTVYSKAELEALSNVCRKHDLIFFIDGARIGYALASNECDLDLPTVAANCDVFYIGGTKIGALCGEAVVFTNANMPKNFRTIVKQHGALVAKGRLLSVQFCTLFSDNLYFEISKHAVDMAMRMKEILISKGYEFFIDSPTNLQFIVLDQDKTQKLSEKLKFTFSGKTADGKNIIRLATSWYTRIEDIEKLKDIL
ncbi:aminotransferase class V-fold PLP-dependent enzyme [Actinomyces sp. zg-332]|uniref:threonine aldolase family protein n=1 Tax=Actinomyces sp. zg-332 TaxID=2708340 RepID=UPI001420F5BF|nr:aminotransferase class V-fold PLP-dependent enzyme [Actinomyces sp. zg-332]QPK93688.1 aminotransferase class V-fold PLP-dependent enzyme [Actinomyces sp. zg-332]